MIDCLIYFFLSKLIFFNTNDFYFLFTVIKNDNQKIMEYYSLNLKMKAIYEKNIVLNIWR